MAANNQHRRSKKPWKAPLSRLPIAEVRRLAREHGLAEIGEAPYMLSYLHADSGARINVWYTTGTVATALDHPRSGKTQLFRRGQDLAALAKIFRDPREHTGVGYYTKHQTPPRTAPDTGRSSFASRNPFAALLSPEASSSSSSSAASSSSEMTLTFDSELHHQLVCFLEDAVDDEWRDVGPLLKQMARRYRGLAGLCKIFINFAGLSLVQFLASFPDVLAVRSTDDHRVQIKRSSPEQAIVVAENAPRRGTRPPPGVSIFPLPGDEVFLQPATAMFDNGDEEGALRLAIAHRDPSRSHRLLAGQAQFLYAWMAFDNWQRSFRTQRSFQTRRLMADLCFLEQAKDALVQAYELVSEVYAHIIDTDASSRDRAIYDRTASKLQRILDMVRSDAHRVRRQLERVIQSIQRRLNPMVRERNHVRDNVIGKEEWETNPAPKKDFAERRKQLEVDLEEAEQLLVRVDDISSGVNSIAFSLSLDVA